MLFWNKICGFLSIFFISVFSCSAQEVSLTKSLPAKIPAYQYTKYLSGLPHKTIDIADNYLQKSLYVIPQNYYTQHFGIMCRQELALEKATKIPFRFRLGSLQQCNYLEGKR